MLLLLLPPLNACGGGGILGRADGGVGLNPPISFLLLISSLLLLLLLLVPLNDGGGDGIFGSVAGGVGVNLPLELSLSLFLLLLLLNDGDDIPRFCCWELKPANGLL